MVEYRKGKSIRVVRPGYDIEIGFDGVVRSNVEVMVDVVAGLFDNALKFFAELIKDDVDSVEVECYSSGAEVFIICLSGWSFEVDFADNKLKLTYDDKFGFWWSSDKFTFEKDRIVLVDRPRVSVMEWFKRWFKIDCEAVGRFEVNDDILSLYYNGWEVVRLSVDDIRFLVNDYTFLVFSDLNVEVLEEWICWLWENYFDEMDVSKIASGYKFNCWVWDFYVYLDGDFVVEAELEDVLISLRPNEVKFWCGDKKRSISYKAKVLNEKLIKLFNDNKRLRSIIRGFEF